MHNSDIIMLLLYRKMQILVTFSPVVQVVQSFHFQCVWTMTSDLVITFYDLICCFIFTLSRTSIKVKVISQSLQEANVATGWLVGWSLTALLTQFRSYRPFKVKTMV